MALMGEVRKPVKERIGSEASKCLHVAAVGVAPGYEGAGIATNLLQTALEHATAREFTHLFSECTSRRSRRCHERLGFQFLHSVAVGEFSVDGVRPFAQKSIHRICERLSPFKKRPASTGMRLRRTLSR